MAEKFTYKTRGVCSKNIHFELDEGVVRNVRFEGGCRGNTQGLSALAEGMPAEELISRQRLAEHLHRSPIGMDKAQHGLQRGGFASAVSANEAHNIPPFQRKGNLIQGKTRVVLTQFPDRKHGHRLQILCMFIIHNKGFLSTEISGIDEGLDL